MRYTEIVPVLTHLSQSFRLSETWSRFISMSTETECAGGCAAKRAVPQAVSMPRTGYESGNMSLRSRIVTVLLVASLLPLAILGLGSWVVFGGLLSDKSLEVHQALVRSHAAKIDLYLAERLRALEFASSDLALMTEILR